MKYIIFIFILYSSLLIKAQDRIGLEYGVGYSNILKHTNFNERYKKSTCFSFSLNSVFILKNNFQVKVGLEIERREFSVSGSYYKILGEYPSYYISSDTVYRNRFNEMSYLSLPVTIQYDVKLLKKTYIQIGVGGYYSYLIHQIWSYKYDGGRFLYDNYGPLSPIDNPYTDKYKKFDGGFIFEIGLRYKLNDFLNATITGTWKKGIINIIDSKEISAFNFSNRIGFNLEYVFN